MRHVSQTKLHSIPVVIPQDIFDATGVPRLLFSSQQEPCKVVFHSCGITADHFPVQDLVCNVQYWTKYSVLRS